MDLFVAIAIVWLVSTVVASGIGYLRGRTSDGMTLGVLLGPVGVVLTFLFVPRHRPAGQNSHAVLQLCPADHGQAAVLEQERRLVA